MSRKNARKSKGVANKFGTSSAVREIDRSLLGSSSYPVTVHLGERSEAGEWQAKFLGLPGYYATGKSQHEAIENLWTSIARASAIYDVSRCRGLDPSPANISKFIRALQAKVEVIAAIDRTTVVAGLPATAASIEIEAKGKMSRHTVDSALQNRERWKETGGVHAWLRESAHQVPSVWVRLLIEGGWDDLQHFMETHPERTRAFLAREKFPQI
ncbi:type II toxin-antitoxin system HicB family antitoxin [Novosphingobium mangrovi (ex Huang et al. 2023)]|uniref:Uncharacterized protein n=1 Tax=Novosphingobium mangrovi (ex Huang et al. 2023) TaxID=2976432 RepID=A0ABT2I9C0_9SPHN|nr:hypothetical protein [Novosphingobium mangrovi (ex Huang et al. 2023)]MCT2401376.1 hypothetical protein [Novosphingobium mangrovi (ex Huang et al. 2023)]